MQSITTSQTGTGTSTVVGVDYMIAPFAVGLGAVVSGTVTFTIEYTMQDPMDAGFNPATASWFPVTGMTSISATTGASLTVPCRGVRINVSSGSGTVTLYVQQAGTR